MKSQKKRTNPPRIRKFPLKKISLILYLILAILSIINHKIDNWGAFLTELVVYTGFTIMLDLILENVSIKQIKEDIKLLFE